MVEGMNRDWHESGLTVGQVAARTGIAESAVRWYADQELLPCERVAGNQRRFFADVQCRVAMIGAAQEVGLSLAQIKDALAVLPSGEPPTEQDWARLADHLRAELHQRIERMFDILEGLSAPVSRPR